MSWLLKEERVAECLMSWGRLFQMWGPKCEKVRKPWVLWLKHSILSMLVSDKEWKEREGLHVKVSVAAQKDKRERNLWLRCNTCKQFCILSVQKLGASGVAVGEVCSFDSVELWEWDVQQYFGLSASVKLHSSECPWEENCSSLIWTIHIKLPVALLHLLWGTYGWSWCVLITYSVFRALINSVVCWFCTSALGLVPFQIFAL